MLEGLKLSGFEDETITQLKVARHLMKKAGAVTIRPILPLLLNLKGEPYSLKRYFPFEPFFHTWMARRVLLKTGRQVSKSTSLAARGVAQSICMPYFSTLYVTPLFEMIRRFSQNYVRPFIETSPFSKLFVGATTVKSVLQRSFLNHSQMIFSFAFLDAERTRGVSADQNVYDEVQDLDKDFIPIIRETMSGSKFGGIESYAGTPKTLENTIEALWLDSSQAEWMIPCHHMGCGYQNIPALTHDLIDMIGPYRDDITFDNPGITCRKCGKPVLPHIGFWVHRYPERKKTFAGFHVPQMIMPMHYGDREKWEILLGKQAGKGNTQSHVFFNEVCGESYDTGARLVTVTDLKKAAILPWRNVASEAKKHLGDYTHRVLSVDWGGGGQDRTSFTSLAVLGIKLDGVIDVIWGFRSLTPHEHLREAKLCIEVMNTFSCHLFVHDYTGAGAIRETLMNQAGIPLKNIVPIQYQAATRSAIIQYKEASNTNPRGRYLMDKPRSLVLTCTQIKLGQLRFFEYDYKDADNTGLINEFLALVEEKTDSRTGRDIYGVHRDPHLADDFAQAVNQGCITLYHLTKRWPNLAKLENIRLPRDLINQIHPIEHVDWEGM